MEITILAICLIAAAIQIYLQKRIINAYKERLNEHYKYSDEILRFCLMFIIEYSIKDGVQDYETANRCKELINNLKLRNGK